MTKMWIPELRSDGNGIELGAGTELAKQWRDRYEARTIDERAERTPEGKAVGQHVVFQALHWHYREDDGTHMRFTNGVQNDAVDDSATYNQALAEANAICDAVRGKVFSPTARTAKAVELLRDAGYVVTEVQ